MKRFLILILFSLIFPIQNSSAAPSLDDTIDFLINGSDDYQFYEFYKSKWSIDDNCVLKIERDANRIEGGLSRTAEKVNKIIYLNKVNLNKGVRWKKDHFGNVIGFTLFGKDVLNDMEKGNLYNDWRHQNMINEDRNLKALQHLFGNFCEGAKSAF